MREKVRYDAAVENTFALHDSDVSVTCRTINVAKFND